jgi:glycosyltransferase involved in cell wall biosynthesis
MNTHHASLAVIVCTWNRNARLQQTLDALEAQAWPFESKLQIVVVDNNSSDGTGEGVKQRQSNWRAGHLHYCFEARQGKQFALNTGIQLARELGCQVAAFTDDDIEMPPDWAQKTLREFDDTQLDLVGGKTLVEWPAVGAPAWYHGNMLAVLAGVDLGDQRLAPPPDGYAPAGSNMAARLSLFDRIGGFSEIRFRHMDFEFGRRAASQGAGVAYVPELTVFAPVDPAVLTQRYFRHWYFKAGFSNWAERDPKVRHWLWVPRWVWPQMARDGVRFLALTLRGAPPEQCFAQELQMWRHWGRLRSRWASRWNPKGYSDWVAARAQKKADLY